MCNGSTSNSLFRRILVAVDGSKQADWATELAAEFGQKLGAQVALVHAYHIDPSYSPELAIPYEDMVAERKDIGAAVLERHMGQLPPSVAAEKVLIEGEAAQQIVNVALAWRADLILMGTHGRGRLAQFLVGSTADSVIRMSHCPVLTVAHERRKQVEATCCSASESKGNCKKEREATSA
jgi:nucleotide-binding universal stress UspA family protein